MQARDDITISTSILVNEDENRPLSPKSLRKKRILYFERLQKTVDDNMEKTVDDNMEKTELLIVNQCTRLTCKGGRCRNKIDRRPGMPGNVCYIHYAKLEKSFSL
jgi:hypothetical protein